MIKGENVWDDEIYTIQTTDPVEGGLDGVSNKQAIGLANRTVFLKNQIEQANQQIENNKIKITDEVNKDDGKLVASAKSVKIVNDKIEQLKATTVKGDSGSYIFNNSSIQINQDNLTEGKLNEALCFKSHSEQIGSGLGIFNYNQDNVLGYYGISQHSFAAKWEISLCSPNEGETAFSNVIDKVFSVNHKGEVWTKQLGDLHTYFSQISHSPQTNNIAILRGQISDGNVLPLPEGFKESECKWIVYPAYISRGATIGALNISVDNRRKVNVRVYRGSSSSWVWTVTEKAEYMVIGVR